jgi:RimJ/RimL family protein N-acetyltransferase
MSTEYVIRKAVPDDAEQIVAHFTRIVHEPHNGILTAPEDTQRTVEERRNAIETLADNSLIVVAEAAGQIIGFVTCHGGNRAATRYASGIGISVDVEWRDKGVGTALMRHAVEWARQHPTLQRLELEVFEENARALHVYQKLGFAIEGLKRRAYFKDGAFVNAYMMALIFEK